MKNTLKYVFLILITLLLVSCSKKEDIDSDPVSLNRLLKKMVLKVEDNIEEIELIYDTKGRIEEILSSYKFDYNFYWNSLGQIEILVITVEDDTIIYEYDISKNGKYKSCQITGSDYNQSEEYFYSGNKITKILNYNSDYKLLAERHYKYDNRGNIIEIKHSYFYTDDPNNPFSEYRNEYTYDSKTHPFLQLKNCPISLIWDLLWGINNNTLTIKIYEKDKSGFSNNGNISITYVYDNSGLPVTADMLIKSEDDVLFVKILYSYY